MTPKETYTINRKAREILRSEIVSRRFQRSVDESEVEELIAKGNTRVFVNRERDSLDEVSSESLKDFWNSELKAHVTTDDCADLDSFANGYFFFAELWKGHGGKDILVLFYHH